MVDIFKRSNTKYTNSTRIKNAFLSETASPARRAARRTSLGCGPLAPVGRAGIPAIPLGFYTAAELHAPASEFWRTTGPGQPPFDGPAGHGSVTGLHHMPRNGLAAYTARLHFQSSTDPRHQAAQAWPTRQLPRKRTACTWLSSHVGIIVTPTERSITCGRNHSHSSYLELYIIKSKKIKHFDHLHYNIIIKIHLYLRFCLFLFILKNINHLSYILCDCDLHRDVQSVTFFYIGERGEQGPTYGAPCGCRRGPRGGGPAARGQARPSYYTHTASLRGREGKYITFGVFSI
jgi:hypothetical protein